MRKRDRSNRRQGVKTEGRKGAKKRGERKRWLALREKKGLTKTEDNKDK